MHKQWPGFVFPGFVFRPSGKLASIREKSGHYLAKPVMHKNAQCLTASPEIGFEPTTWVKSYLTSTKVVVGNWNRKSLRKSQ